MRPSMILFNFVCVVLAFSANDPVKAGDYFDRGYQSSRLYNTYSNGGYSGRTVRYSRDCCFEREVRVEKSVRYIRTYSDEYRRSAYDRPNYQYNYRSSYTNGYYSDYRRPYYRSDYEPPRSYAPSYTNAYSGNYGDYATCARRSIRIHDGRGGWVWGEQAGC